MDKLKGTLNIFKKEFKTYFVSPIAYIVICIFLILTGFLFFSTFFINGQTTLRSFFDLLPLIFCFFIPAITMSLYSEELNVGSYELLLTMPVSFMDIVWGKFLAALAFAAIALLPTISYPIFVSTVGKLDWGPIFGGYLGSLLLAAAYCAIGLFASAVTKKQIIALLIGIAISLVLFLMDKLLPLFWPNVVNVIQFLGSDYHFKNIAKGVIDLRDIIYFASICFIAMYGTKLVMEEKK